MHLLVCGHLRNFFYHHKLFITEYFSKLPAKSKHLFTYKNLGWWSGINTVTDGQDIDLRGIVEDGYFDTLTVLKTGVIAEASSSYLPPVSIQRPYLRKENMSKQLALRYISCKAAASTISQNSVVVLTRPDLLPSQATFDNIPMMIEAVNSDPSVVCYMSEPPQDQGDYIFVGTLKNLTWVVSPSAVNQNEYMDVHDFLSGSIKNTEIKLIGFPGMGWHLCNSPNMSRYAEVSQ